MIPFREFRTLLQKPRQSADAWYGKWMARRLSIYVTWFFAHLGLGANQATLLSLVFALIGIASLALGHFALGILSINVWYVLDHVDGELARLRKSSSLGGTFFDTVINFLIQPFTFLGWCFGLIPYFGNEVLLWGALAASGSLMLIAIPITEEAVLFNEVRKTGATFQKTGKSGSSGIEKQNLVKKMYTLIHTFATFPSILCILTVGYFLLLIFTRDSEFHIYFLHRLLMIDAFLVTAIWILELVYKIYFQPLDGRWKSV